jgi:DNA polymerase-3 subunit epsilon
LVHVKDREIIAEETLLIRPPQRQFNFTHIHGLTWDDVKDQPTFVELWADINGFISRADRGVLQQCCENYGIPVPSLPFVCTVQLARKQWDIFPTKLPNVCDYLDIPLNHHDAASDSQACAKIVIAAENEGWRF